MCDTAGGFCVVTNGECPHARHTTVCGPSRWFAGKPSAADPQDWPPLSKWTTLSSGLLTLAVPDTALLSIPLVSGDALGPVLACAVSIVVDRITVSGVCLGSPACSVHQRTLTPRLLPSGLCVLRHGPTWEAEKPFCLSIDVKGF